MLAELERATKGEEKSFCFIPSLKKFLNEKVTLNLFFESHNWEVDKAEPHVGMDSVLVRFHCMYCGLKQVMITYDIEDAQKVLEQDTKQLR